LVKKQDNLIDVAVEGRAVQEIEALIVGEERVGAVIEKEVDDVVVAALGCP
jgi:hypothetical protein